MRINSSAYGFLDFKIYRDLLSDLFGFTSACLDSTAAFICILFLVVPCMLWISAQTISNENTPAQFQGKIVSLAPNLTEMVFALGEGHRVIGVTDFDLYPPEVKSLPRLGGYLNPDYEMLIKLKPDVILLLQGRSQLEAKLESMGFTCWVYHCETYPEIIDTILDLGTKLGVRNRAQDLIKDLEKALGTSEISSISKPSVMIVVGTSPGSLQKIYVSGSGSFLDYLLEHVGAKNIFHDQLHAYFEVSKEEIIARQPEIIIDLNPGMLGSEDAKHARLQSWQNLAVLPAVQKSRIFIITEDFVLIPGPRVAETARIFRQVIQEVVKTE